MPDYQNCLPDYQNLQKVKYLNDTSTHIKNSYLKVKWYSINSYNYYMSVKYKYTYK